MRLNNDIKGVSEVRLINEDGNMVGVVPFSAALNRARECDLDLCEISPNAEPPVCRIMDYGKFLYQQKKKEHDNQRKHQHHEQKQIRIKSFRIDPHDLGIKLKSTRKFIEAGHRVLVTLMFRARENDHPELGQQVLEKQFFKQLEDVCKMDARPRKEGRKMTMSLTPLPNLSKILDTRRKEQERLAKEESQAAEVTEEPAVSSEEVEVAEQESKSDDSE